MITNLKERLVQTAKWQNEIDERLSAIGYSSEVRSSVWRLLCKASEAKIKNRIPRKSREVAA